MTKFSISLYPYSGRQVSLNDLELADLFGQMGVDWKRISYVQWRRVGGRKVLCFVLTIRGVLSEYVENFFRSVMREAGVASVEIRVKD